MDWRTFDLTSLGSVWFDCNRILTPILKKTLDSALISWAISSSSQILPFCQKIPECIVASSLKPTSFPMICLTIWFPHIAHQWNSPPKSHQWPPPLLRLWSPQFSKLSTTSFFSSTSLTLFSPDYGSNSQTDKSSSATTSVAPSPPLCCKVSLRVQCLVFSCSSSLYSSHLSLCILIWHHGLCPHCYTCDTQLFILTKYITTAINSR